MILAVYSVASSDSFKTFFLHIMEQIGIKLFLIKDTKKRTVFSTQRGSLFHMGISQLL